MNNKIERYYSHRVKNIFNQIHDFEISITESTLHDFRVEIKKIKTVTKFLKSVYGKSEIKKIKNILDSTFQEVGNIRELQLMHNWFEENNFEEIEKNFFNKYAISTFLTSFRNKLPDLKKDLDKLLKPNIKLLEKTNQIVVDQYVLKLKYSIEKRLQKKQIEPEWHQLRKLIKQWSYSTNWVSSEENTFEIKRLYAYCNKLQELIGNWHDQIIIQEFLLDMQFYVSKELAVQKEYVMALKKINTTIEATQKEVKTFLKKYQLLKKEASI